MGHPLRIPKLGWSMTTGVIVRWLVDDSAQVSEDTPLYILETDKVENEISAGCKGTVRLIGEPGETYAVGDVIAEVETS